MIKVYQLHKLQNSYEVTLYYKGVKVRVAFTGGNVYKNTYPKFRTDDLFKMKAIENSELFKNKEVSVVRTIGEKPSVQKPVVQQRKKVVKPAIQKPAVPHVQQPVTPPTFDEAQGTPESQIPEQSQTDGDGGQTMEFANLGEAILYVAQNYQTEAQTEKEVRDILKSNGINPKIKRG